MADGDSTATGMGMGMIIGLLIVLLIVVVGGFYMFSGGGKASNPVSSVAEGASHTVSGTVKVN